ncbi:MAG TPA: hypothetical protein VKP61_15330 [Candidatus Acidoferrum sp.]|nr:hypothetical protein [Candidatus Acidoferrum sp.]
MPHCKACGDPRRTEIDTQLVRGAPLRSVSQSFGISVGSLHRHKAHIRADLALAIRSQPGEREERASGLLSRVEELIVEAKSICTEARTDKKYAAATNALNTVVHALELLGKLNGELQQPGGLHLTQIRVTNINAGHNDDAELAELIREATGNWNPAVIARFQALTDRVSHNSAIAIPQAVDPQ